MFKPLPDRARARARKRPTVRVEKEGMSSVDFCVYSIRLDNVYGMHAPSLLSSSSSSSSNRVDCDFELKLSPIKVEEI